ncbi:MAG: DMT family transporter [Actinobacteria bacterium]|nr:DMT family transporter [Actinomycetota bacterium]
MTNSFMGRIPVPILLGVTMFFWGAAFNATDVAFDYAPAGVITFMRAGIATVLLLALMPILGGKFPRSRTIWLFALVVGAGSTTLSLAGLGLGTQYAGPAIASVLLNTAPFFAVLFARISLNERIKLLRGIGLVVGFAGVVIIVLSNPTETGSGGQFIFGVVAVMIGAVGYAIASVVVRYMNVKEIVADLWGFTFAQFLCGTILLIPFALLSGDPGSTQWDSPGFWLTMGFLGIGPQLVAYACFFVALARWPSGRVMAWSFLPPVVAGVIEIMRGNIPGAVTLLGMAVAIVGVAIVNHPKAESTDDHPVATIDPDAEYAVEHPE